MTEKSLETDVETAWRRASPIAGRDPALYRIAPDIIRSVIRRDRYNIRGEFGWRIECGRPVAFRETTIASAIRALQQRDWPSATTRPSRIEQAGQSQR
ncbi:MAG: hypothetical protein JSU82_08445 [Rhodospirillales bacterium]|nr:MAG: hypothetical protein JSU82_08445 [Rhodospirillales bacterium]